MPRLALLLLALLVSACDTVGGSQALFEDEAYGLPPGAAPTWRVSPALDTRIEFYLTPPSEPVNANDSVTLQFFDNSPSQSGYAVYYLTDQVPRELVLIEQTPGQNQATFYFLTFFGSNVNAGNPGTYRLIVLDAGERVVAFGDLTIQ